MDEGLFGEGGLSEEGGVHWGGGRVRGRGSEGRGGAVGAGAAEVASVEAVAVSWVGGETLWAGSAVGEGEEDEVSWGEVGGGGARVEDYARAFMSEDSVGRAWEEASSAREISMAEAGGDDLDEDFIRLDVVEVDFLELELAV